MLKDRTAFWAIVPDPIESLLQNQMQAFCTDNGIEVYVQKMPMAEGGKILNRDTEQEISGKVWLVHAKGETEVLDKLNRSFAKITACGGGRPDKNARRRRHGGQ